MFSLQLLATLLPQLWRWSSKNVVVSNRIWTSNLYIICRCVQVQHVHSFYYMCGGEQILETNMKDASVCADTGNNTKHDWMRINEELEVLRDWEEEHRKLKRSKNLNSEYSQQNKGCLPLKLTKKLINAVRIWIYMINFYTFHWLYF